MYSMLDRLSCLRLLENIHRVPRLDEQTHVLTIFLMNKAIEKTIHTNEDVDFSREEVQNAIDSFNPRKKARFPLVVHS